MNPFRFILLSAATIALHGCFVYSAPPPAKSVGMMVKNADAGSSTVWVTSNPGQVLGFDENGDISSFTIAAGGGTWGTITGTLSEQTDLQTALNLKLASSAVSAFGLTLIDDTTASAARSTLGLGTLATQSGTLTDYMAKATYDPQNVGYISGAPGLGGFGGTLNLNAGDDGPGGSISTENGGGSISTGGTGEIQLGTDGQRTILLGTATLINRTITFPDLDGELALVAYTAGRGDVTLSGLTMGTGKILGRTSASTGAIQELAIPLTVTNGGTGATSASAARTALGLVIGTNVLAPNGSGASLTSLNASALSSGTVGTARLGTGTASSSTFLRGDGTWATPTGSGDVVGPGSATDNALTRMDGTTGKLIQNSAATLDDGGNLSLLSAHVTDGFYAEFEVDSCYLGATVLQWNDGTYLLQLAQSESPTLSWTFYFPPNPGSSGQVLTTDGMGVTSWATPNSGTVTSVAVSGSDGIEIDSGSPITSSGTIALGINASALATHLGLASSYQPLDSDLTDIAALAPTKGRILVADGSNWGDLNVGTDGQVLTADSGEDKGVIWATPSGGGGTSVDVQTFTTSGTWTKPAGAVSCRIIMVGGGGGGGSGRRGAADTDRSGGGGGGTGSSFLIECFASDLSATEAVIIGSGGAGAAGITTDNTNGAEGDTGGSTTFSIFTAAGGDGGNGGTTTSGSGGLVRNYSAGGPSQFDQQALGGGAGSNTSGASGTTSSFMVRPTGGGGGGGLTAANARNNGGTGGTMLSSAAVVATIAGGQGGNSGTTNAGDGEDGSAFLWTGTGGGGGRAGSTDGTVAGKNGGNGGGPGAGGGGGGASLNGADSGAGGDGADGYLRVETLIQN